MESQNSSKKHEARHSTESLTGEKLLALIREYQNPQTREIRRSEILQDVFTAFLGFTRAYISKNYLQFDLDLDAFQFEAMPAMWRALEKYQFDKSSSFVNYYKIWLRSVLNDAVYSQFLHVHLYIENVIALRKALAMIGAGMHEEVDRALLTRQLIANGLSKEVANDLACIPRKKAQLEKSELYFRYRNVFEKRDEIEEKIDLEDDNARLWAIVSSLKPNQREIIVRHFRDGEDRKIIGDELGVSKQAVHSRIECALANLRKMIEDNR